MKFFARARDLAGCAEAVWAIPHDCTVAQLRLRLSETFPSMNSIAAHLLVAIDGDYAADDMIVENGDEVAFFPPVSGG